MLLRDAGFEIHYMNIANGCCGTTQYDRETIARIRRDEGRSAAESIGAVFHESICNDIEIFYDHRSLTKLAAVVRDVAPEILLTHSPVDYMEDHTNTCRLAVTAAFCRGMPNYPVEPPTPITNQPVTVYHAQPYFNRDPLRNVTYPDFYVDVTGLMDRKTDMLSKHESQKKWLDESQGLDSYFITLRELNAEIGQMSGCFQFAEGWRRHLHIGFCGADDDPLVDALKDNVATGPPPTA